MKIGEGVLAFIGVAAGFSLSFVGLGLFWIGLNPGLQSVHSISFFLLCFVLARFLKIFSLSFIVVIAGAAPISLLITQFRDQNGSHLIPILIVFSWIVGAGLGSWLGANGSRGN